MYRKSTILESEESRLQTCETAQGAQGIYHVAGTMLSSQLYRDAGLSGLARFSAGNSAASSPAYVPSDHICADGHH